MYWTLCLFLIVTISMGVCGHKSESKIEVLKHNKSVMCSVGTSAFDRELPLDFNVSDIDPTLCTHVLYAGGVLDEISYTLTRRHQKYSIESQLESYPHIKFIISLGGWLEGSVKYSIMAADKYRRAKFIRSVIDYLEKYKAHGLNLHWVYPTKYGGEPEDRENFVFLIKELKEVFFPYGYTLMATLCKSTEIMIEAYDLASLDRYLDLILVDSYDYHGPWNELVGPVSPLRGYNKTDVYSVEYTIKYMLSFGISPHKLVLGIPFYGRTYILTDPNVTEIELGKTATASDGFSGPYIHGDSFYGYNEICRELTNKSNNWSHHWDDKSSSPYIRDGERVITYHSTRSIANKIKFAIDYNLGGFEVWTIDMDDYMGACDLDNETYTDYMERFNNLTNDRSLRDSLNYIFSPRAVTSSNLIGNAYRTSNDKLIFNVPEEKFNNYPLLRTINQAIGIALEEKEINDAIQRVRKGEHIFRWKTVQAGQVPDWGRREHQRAPCVETCSRVCFDGSNF